MRNVIALILPGFILTVVGTADAAKVELILGSYHCVETLANGHSVRTELGIQGTGGLLPNNGLALRDIATGDAIGPGCPEATASFVKNVRSLGCTAGPVRLTTAPTNQPETGTYSFSFSCEGGRNQLVRALGELTREFLTALGF